ncbi:MAG: SAM-dependent methyltransferase [Actinomycetota bacterium]
MTDCCNPSGYRDFFDEKEARRSLRRYEKKGLHKLTRSFVDYLITRGMEGRTVLEGGGGIGAIQIELLDAGADSAVNVELSGEYERVAADLLERRGLSDRVRRLVGDFTDLAPDLKADDVVLNRVICCYPYVDRLMSAALASSRRFVAATFPRDRLLAKLAVGVANTYCKLRRIDFRSFVHSTDRIEAAAASEGFEVVFRTRTLVWEAVVFERVA